MKKPVKHFTRETHVPVSGGLPPVHGRTARGGSAWFGSIFILCCAFSLVVLFFPFLASHLDRTLSDFGDGRFELAILEHWTKVFHGQARASSPDFFYPEKGVLGYSDAFLGLSLVHAIFRWLGADRYLAVQLATMLLVGLGFVAMYCLMRDLRLARSTCLTGSTLFIISNMYYVYVVHPYILVSVVGAPILFLLAGKYWQQKDIKPARALLYLCASSVLLALTFYTSYYIGWFLVLCSIVLAALYAFCCAVVERRWSVVSRITINIWQQKWSLIVAGIVFLLSMAPFFALYLPSLHRTGKRSLGETLVLMPRPLGIFDVGRENLVWAPAAGRIELWLAQSGGVHEQPVGWPILTITVFLVTVSYLGVQLLRTRHSRSRLNRQTLLIMSSIALTCLTLWTAGVRFGAHAPVWILLTRVIPGAAAIRIPQRIDLVLNIGVVIVCVYGLEVLRRRLALFGALAYLVPAFLVGGMAIEQLNVMPTHLLSRQAEARKFVRIPPPPQNCSSFFVSDWSNTNLGMINAQTDAMMVAQEYGIPTVNGTSSWFPTGWGLITVEQGAVARTAMNWAKLKGISDGLCALEMNWGVWKTAAEEEQEEASTHVSPPAPGVITNSGFEDSDMSAWDLYQYVRATLGRSEIHSGSHSLEESEAEGSVYQDVSGLKSGQRYRISAWVAASTGATAGGYIAVWDPLTNAAVVSKTLHPETGWQLVSESVTASSGGTLRIHLFRTGGTGTIYWDDVSITPYNESNSSETAN